MYPESMSNVTLDSNVMTLLETSKFVGVGGTKWWLLDTELHGKFSSKWKYKKYGNQWSKFFKPEMVPDAAVLIVGSNDCDDYNNCILQKRPAGMYDEKFDEISTWYISLLRYLCMLLYIPV